MLRFIVTGKDIVAVSALILLAFANLLILEETVEADPAVIPVAVGVPILKVLFAKGELSS